MKLHQEGMFFYRHFIFRPDQKQGLIYQHHCHSVGLSFYSLIFFKYMDTQTDGQTDRRTVGQTDIWTDGQTDRWTDRKTDRRTDGQMDRRTDGQTDRRTDGQTDRRTDRFFALLRLNCPWENKLFGTAGSSGSNFNDPCVTYDMWQVRHICLI